MLQNKLSHHKVGLLFLATVLSIIVAGMSNIGCGEGSKTAGTNQALATDSRHGALQFRISFPPITRSPKTKQYLGKASSAKRTREVGTGGIPIGTQSVRISLTNPNTNTPIVADRVINNNQRPVNGEPSIVVGYALIPVGPIRAKITCHSDLEANSPAIGEGVGTGVIQALTTTTIRITITLLLSTLTLQPSTLDLDLNNTPSDIGTLTGTARDAQGNILNLPLQYTIANNQVAIVSSVSSDFRNATIVPISPGVTTVTVTEVNSGRTASSTVNVTFGGGGCGEGL